MYLILLIGILQLLVNGGISTGSPIGVGPQNETEVSNKNKLDRVFEYMQYLDSRYGDYSDKKRDEILEASSIRQGNCRDDMTLLMPLSGKTMTRGVCRLRVGVCGRDGAFYCGCDIRTDYKPDPHANNDGTAFDLPYSQRVSADGWMYCFALVGNGVNAFTDRGAINLPEIDLKTELLGNKFKRKCHERCQAKSLETFFCSDVQSPNKRKRDLNLYVWWLEVVEYCVCSCPGTGAGRLPHGHGSKSGGPGRLPKTWLDEGWWRSQPIVKLAT